MPNSHGANTRRPVGQMKLSVILAFALALGLGGCNKKASTETLLQDAQRFQEKGDHKSAVIQLKNALQSSPENAEIRYRLGSAYNLIGDGASAEKELKKALELQPDHPKASMELGGSLLRQGAFDRVLAEMKVPPAGAANLADVLVLRAQAHAGLRQIKESEEDFNAALAARPGFGDALIGSARLKASTQDVEGGLKLLEQVLAKDP